jgi:FtsP/CotA-like multicopper oxidase with cupredoxin domain
VNDQQQIAGTYMYHCHVEDVEHVHMGLTGVIFIRPALNKTLGAKFAYNDPSTRYDREYAFILTEADVQDHWNDAHKQENDFTQFTPKFALMNGRGYPDTLDGNGTQVDGFHASDPRLASQPWSSLIQANAGETVLLRFSNLGFQEHSMELPGIPMRVVGKDAKQLTANRPAYYDTGTSPPAPPPTRPDISYWTYRVELGPGESRDVLFVAPDVPSGKKSLTYDFFDRNYEMVANKPNSPYQTYGGMRTEVRIYPPKTLPDQTVPQQLFAV